MYCFIFFETCTFLRVKSRYARVGSFSVALKYRWKFLKTVCDARYGSEEEVNEFVKYYMGKKKTLRSQKNIRILWLCRKTTYNSDFIVFENRPQFRFIKSGRVPLLRFMPSPSPVSCSPILSRFIGGHSPVIVGVLSAFFLGPQPKPKLLTRFVPDKLAPRFFWNAFSSTRVRIGEASVFVGRISRLSRHDFSSIYTPQRRRRQRTFYRQNIGIDFDDLTIFTFDRCRPTRTFLYLSTRSRYTNLSRRRRRRFVSPRNRH